MFAWLSTVLKVKITIGDIYPPKHNWIVFTNSVQQINLLLAIFFLFLDLNFKSKWSAVSWTSRKYLNQGIGIRSTNDNHIRRGKKKKKIACLALDKPYPNLFYSIYTFCFSPFWLRSQMVKRLSTMWETQDRSPGWEDSLAKEMAIHSSTIAWKIPWTAGPGRLQSMGSQRVGHDGATSR